MVTSAMDKRGQDVLSKGIQSGEVMGRITELMTFEQRY